MKKTLLISLGFLSGFLFTGVAPAAIFQVNLTVQDHVDDDPGDGVCDIPTGGFCTLRAAIMEANALPGPDIIILPGNATIQLTRTGTNENASATGDLDITESVSIGTFVEDTEDYPTVQANFNDDRVFDVRTNNNELVQFLRFKVTNGSSNSNGGAINIGPGEQVEVDRVWFEDNNAVSGGAIYVSATSILDVNDSVFVGNAAASQGGALTTFGKTSIDKSTIFDNLNFNDGFQEALYAGYTNLGEDGLTVRNSTLFNNSETGVFSIAADVSLRNTTIVGHNRGHGVFVNSGSVVPRLRIQNTIFDQNDVACSHGIIDTSYNNWNISSDVSCLDGGSTNLTEDPQISSLKVDNENWHRYYRPGFYSVVVDNAHPTAPGPGLGCDAEDQRGVIRPQDGDHDGSGRCDRGAIELLEDIIFYDDYDIQY